MSVSAIRFRTEGALVVLQVLAEDTSAGATWNQTYSIELKWRDAKVEDLIAAAEFMQPRRQT
jgi:hypothetical protein